MLPIYTARIEDLGPGDFVKVDCAACHRVALLPPEALCPVADVIGERFDAIELRVLKKAAQSTAHIRFGDTR